MLRRRENNSKAQVFVEYSIIIGLVVTVLISMNIMIKRGLQGMIKSVADQIGNQANADQKMGNLDDAYLDSQYSSTRTSSNKTTTELAGDTGYSYDSVVSTETNTITNMGFTEDD